MTLNSHLTNRRSIELKAQGTAVNCLCIMRDVQPRDEEVSVDLLYVGGMISQTYELLATVFADNLSQPIKFSLRVIVNAIDKSLEMDKFFEYAHNQAG